jgi:hypothetical protein
MDEEADSMRSALRRSPSLYMVLTSEEEQINPNEVEALMKMNPLMPGWMVKLSIRVRNENG